MDRDLVSRRCIHHWQREAVARCPECRRFYCRECITEHEDRILCANCIKAFTGRTVKTGRSRIVWRGVQFLVSFVILWTFFYYIGKALLLMPDEFHEGTVWQEDGSS